MDVHYLIKNLRRNDIVIFYDQVNKENFVIIVIDYKYDMISYVDKDYVQSVLYDVEMNELVFRNKINAKRLCKNCLINMTCNKDDIFTCAENYFERK